MSPSGSFSLGASSSGANSRLKLYCPWRPVWSVTGAETTLISIWARLDMGEARHGRAPGFDLARALLRSHAFVVAGALHLGSAFRDYQRILRKHLGFEVKHEIEAVGEHVLHHLLRLAVAAQHALGEFGIHVESFSVGPLGSTGELEFIEVVGATDEVVDGGVAPFHAAGRGAPTGTGKGRVAGFDGDDFEFLAMGCQGQ